MASWKKVLVSGSSAELSNLVVDQHVSASLFSGSFVGDGSGLTGLTSAAITTYTNAGDNKLITSVDATSVQGEDNLTFDGTTLTVTGRGSFTGGVTGSSFTGSFVGDGSGLTSVSVGNALTAGSGLTSAGTFDGAVARTFSVNSGSLLPYYSSSVFGTVSGDVTITTAGVASIANNVVDENNLTTSVAGTGLAGGNGSALSVSYGSTAGTAAQGNTSVTFAGTANEIELSTNTFTTVGGGGSVTIGLPDNVTITSDLTVGGNITVSGDLTYLNTANLLVEDAFILLASGSAGTGDSGIIFGGSEGVAQSGSAVFWDASYNTNDGRLAVANGVGHGTTSPLTPAYSIAGVYEGTEANAATAQADHPGNIRIEAGEIYIYV